jgi:SAM-dependent methyltransferase
MGITLPTARLFIELGLTTPFSGSVLQLGKQDIYFSDQELQEVARRLGFPLHSTPLDSPVQNRFLRGMPLVMSDHAFFGRIGFEKIASLDASDFEGASIFFDLNLPDTPPNIAGTFDLIFDGGTLEHVFHLPNALRNVANLLKPGGVIVHVSPVHNFFDHGFYCFNPTLFADFYRANRFESLTCQLIRFNADGDVNRAERVFLLPPQEHVKLLARTGSLNDRSHVLFFAARKTIESDGAVIPQQSAYAEIWSGTMPDEGKRGEKRRLAKVVRKLAKKNNRLFAIYSRLEARLRARAVRWESF